VDFDPVASKISGSVVVAAGNGRAMTDSKRQAHSDVAQMVLQVKTADAVVEENPEPQVNVV
jgi:hypothetical protein